MAEKAQASWPTIRTSARENRAFLGRAVRYLAGQVGIRQFLDIGAGLPSADTRHASLGSAAFSCLPVHGGVGDDAVEPVPGAHQIADLPVDTIPLG